MYSTSYMLILQLAPGQDAGVAQNFPPTYVISLRIVERLFVNHERAVAGEEVEVSKKK